MTTAAGLLLLGCVPPLRAAIATSQTLEALHSAAVPIAAGTAEAAASQGGKFFDASASGISVSSPKPVAFTRLPAPPTSEIRFGDSTPASGVHIHSPKKPQAPRNGAAWSSAKTAGTLAVGGVAAVVAALLVGGALAGPLGIVGGLLLVAALTVFLSSRR